MEDWTLVHLKFHEARKREGVVEASQRKALQRQLGQEKNEDDDGEKEEEDLVFLIDDELDSEDDGNRAGADPEIQEGRRRRMCHAFDCGK